MKLQDVIETERLILRGWSELDAEPFIEMNADPDVMYFLPKILTPQESLKFLTKIKKHFDDFGFGLYAVELKANKKLLGFVGLSNITFDAPFGRGVEIGWRLKREYWGRGYAFEASKAVIKFAFEKLNLNEVLSFTVPHNARSRRVMEKLGMTYDEKEMFDHPLLTPEHPLSRHVLYRLKK